MDIEWIVLMIGLIIPFAFALGVLVGNQRVNNRRPYEYEMMLAEIADRRLEEERREGGCAGTLLLIVLMLVIFLLIFLH